MTDNDYFEELHKALDHLHKNATQVSPASEAANLLGSALAVLEACHRVLEPFARMYRWTNLPSTDDEAQVLWRKHWLTGERMQLTTEHFRLAAVAFYHYGVLPTNIEHAEEEAAEAMAQEILRQKRVKGMQDALDEFAKDLECKEYEEEKE